MAIFHRQVEDYCAGLLEISSDDHGNEFARPIHEGFDKFFESPGVILDTLGTFNYMSEKLGGAQLAKSFFTILANFPKLELPFEVSRTSCGSSEFHRRNGHLDKQSTIYKMLFFKSMEYCKLAEIQTGEPQVELIDGFKHRKLNVNPLYPATQKLRCLPRQPNLDLFGGYSVIMLNGLHCCRVA